MTPRQHAVAVQLRLAGFHPDWINYWLGSRVVELAMLEGMAELGPIDTWRKPMEKK